MPVDKLLDPTGPSAFLIAILVASLIAMLVAIVFALWFYHYQPIRAIKLQPVRMSDRERWVQRIDVVVARHIDSADEQARELHIDLAAELRNILGERAGMDLRSWQPSHLRRVATFENAADAIRSWEEPSFAPYAHGDIPKARDRAVEAVLSW